MGKKLLITLLVLVLLVGGAGAFLYLNVAKSPTATAFLNVHDGNVLLDSGSGWETAEDGMRLSLDDRVKTEDGNADVILYESVIVSLEPETTIQIADLTKEHPKISLEQGSVWNKFTGLLGVESYDVETPTTVATVRGTEFGVAHKKNISEVFVAEGGVDVTDEDETMRVGAHERVRKEIAKGMVKEAMSAAEIDGMEEKQKRTLEALKNLREREIDKSTVLLKVAETQGYNRAEIRDKLVDVDDGKLDDRKIAGMVPIQTESVDKLLALNDMIKEQKRELGNKVVTPRDVEPVDKVVVKEPPEMSDPVRPVIP